MPGISGVVHLRTVMERAIEVGGTRVTPESQILEVRLPFGEFCCLWHRPTAVVVKQGGRAIQRVPIVDLTRVAQVGVLIGTLLLAALWLIAASVNREP